MSRDGYRFTDVNDGQPVLSGEAVAGQKGIRDPYLMRGEDGAFYLTMTDLHIYAQKEGLRSTEWERPAADYGWGNNRAIILMKSRDLSHSQMEGKFATYSGAPRARAPRTHTARPARRETVLIAQEAQNLRERAAGEAEARGLEAAAEAERIRAVEGARAEAERERVATYRDLPPAVLLGLAAREFAGKLDTIEHLTINPDLLAAVLGELRHAPALAAGR